MRKAAWWPWAVFVILLGCAAYSQILQQHQQEGPRVQSKQESSQSVSSNQDANGAAPAHESPSGKPQDATGAEHAENGEILGVKRGEWLLFLATLLLWYATMRLVWDARENSQRQLRAYVNIDRCLLVDFGANQPISAVLHLRNSGNTPAYEMQCVAFFKSGPFPAERFAEGKEPTQKNTLPPGGTSTMLPGRDNPIVLTADQVKAIEAKDAAIWVHGFIYYVDAFKKRRTTRFRLIYRGIVNTDPPGGMIFAQEGNHSD